MASNSKLAMRFVLTDKGREQAEDVVKKLHDIGLTDVLASKRAVNVVADGKEIKEAIGDDFNSREKLSTSKMEEVVKRLDLYGLVNSIYFPNKIEYF